jgi:hypothetical protein
VELTPKTPISLSANFSNVPEPAALALTAAGLLIVSRIHRKRTQSGK